MENSNYMKRTQCTLTTITPCHVGSGRILSRNMDFVTNGEELGILDPRKIYGIIGETGINAWCNAINKNGNIFELIRKTRPKIRLQDVCSHTATMYGGTPNIKELREQFSSGGKSCIPGSSIKGAIVTAILASYPQGILGELHGRDILGQVFQKTDPKTSILRCLRVGDAHFDIQPKTIVFNCVSLNIRSKRSLIDNKAQQFVECIYTDEPSIFDIDLIDTNNQYSEALQQYTGNIPEVMKSIDALFSCINRHTLTLLNEELRFWEERYNDEKLEIDIDLLNEYTDQIKSITEECKAAKKSAIIRLGYGSGYNFITGNWYHRIHCNDQEWGNALDRIRPNNNRYTDFPYIKTRRIFYDCSSDYLLPLGFVRIAIVQNK